MSYKRRDFIKNTTAIASGLALSTIAGKLTACSSANSLSTTSAPFGIQLYTLRNEMPNDPKSILRQLASFGYKQIESFEHERLGMYWGMKSTELKKFLDDLGMKLVSSHTDINKDFERKAEEAAAINMNYLICPYFGPQKTLDAFKKEADKFNKCGEICRKNGIRFAYHNHDYSFKLVEGQYPQDVFMSNTGKDLVDYEMDIYWVVTAGQDPVQWMKKYPNRFKLAHIKDRLKNKPLTEKDVTTTLGKGSINYTQILAAGKKQGLQFFLYEQEQYEGTTPLKASQESAVHMKGLKLSV